MEAHVRLLNDGIVAVQLQPRLEREPSILAGTLANLFASAPVGFLVVDRSGTITLANPEAERIFGYTGRVLSGKHVDQLVADSKGHGRLREGFMKGGHMRMMGAGRDLHGVRANGLHVPVEVALAPLRHNGQDAVLAVVADITDRRKAPTSVHDSEIR